MRTLRRQIWDDRLFLWHARASRIRYFRDGIDSPPLWEHVRALEFELPKLTKVGRTPFEVTTLAGDVGAAVHVHTPGMPDAPVLIWHHDAGELPPTRTLAQMFPDKSPTDLTIFVVEAPLHDNRDGPRVAGSSLIVHLAVLAVAVSVTERLLEWPRIANAPLTVVAGLGQGGYIANWHHLLRDTADLYIPFMAGTAEAEQFLSALPTAKAARRRPDHLRELLNFDAKWAERPHGNVFPVLGCGDVINRLEDQARAYGNTPVEVWPVSHSAAAKSAERMRAKIERHIAEALAERGEPVAAPAAPRPRLLRARG
jgi:hypothetical protein